MRILILQFVPPGAPAPGPRFDHALGVAAALLQADGFEVGLEALAGYHPGQVRQALTRFRPTHVLMDVSPTRLTAARHVAVDLAQKHALPVYLVGDYATAMPEQAISIPGVAGLVVGAYQRAVRELMVCLRDGQDAQVGDLEQGQMAQPLAVPGLWYNSEDGLVQNPPSSSPPAPEELPWPDRSLFNYAQHVAATGQAEFRATLGCDRWCGFCLNEAYLDLYEQPPMRRRSVSDLLGEIQAVRQAFGPVARLRFTDHGFAVDKEWLAEFAPRYAQQVGLPFRCHVQAARMDEQTAGLLVRAGARDVDLQIGSGNDFLRQEVLAMPVSRQQVLATVAALRLAGLKVHGKVFIGCPYETEVTLEETLDLLARVRLDSVQPSIFYPVPGTAAEETCRDNGWLSGRDERNFLARHSVLDQPSMPAQRIDKVYRQFSALLRRRRHDWRGWLTRCLSPSTKSQPNQ